MIKTVIGYCC